MRKVVIEYNWIKPILRNCPKNVEVVFIKRKKRPLKRRLKTLMYNVKALF